MAATTPGQVDYIRLCTFRGALKLEARGMKMSRGASALSIAKKQGLVTSRTTLGALEEINALIAKHPDNPNNQ
jgi:hypothetical protein